LAPIPCAVSGSNNLVLAQNSGSQAASVSLLDYQNYVMVCGIGASNNGGATTARVGTLPILNVYKDTASGIVPLGGGEILQGAAFTLMYDSALNSGAGGWHLISNMTTSGSNIFPALVSPSIGVKFPATTPTVTGVLAASATLTYTSIVPGAGQDQSFTVAGLLRTDGLAMALPLPVSTGLTFTSYFAAGDATVGTVTVRAANFTTASTITPGAVTVGMKAVRTT